MKTDYRTYRGPIRLTVKFGYQGDVENTYGFDTPMEADAFIYALGEAAGWGDNEITSLTLNGEEVDDTPRYDGPDWDRAEGHQTYWVSGGHHYRVVRYSDRYEILLTVDEVLGWPVYAEVLEYDVTDEAMTRLRQAGHHDFDDEVITGFKVVLLGPKGEPTQYLGYGVERVREEEEE